MTLFSRLGGRGRSILGFAETGKAIHREARRLSPSLVKSAVSTMPMQKLAYLLDIEEGEGDRLPHVHPVLASHLEVLVPLLLNQRVVLDRHRVPHDVAL